MNNEITEIDALCSEKSEAIQSDQNEVTEDLKRAYQRMSSILNEADVSFEICEDDSNFSDSFEDTMRAK